MSKIYDKYLKLKSSDNYDNNTLYLFKSGLFFIFIDKDAELVSNMLNLKLSNLNENIVKCGFPCNSLQKYLTILKNTPYNVEIVSINPQEKPITSNNYLTSMQFEKIADEILNTKIDNLSISQAYDFLYKIQNQLKDLK